MNPVVPANRPGSRQYARWSLWALLIALVAALVVTLVWLAGRYEASQVQSKLERDTADALGDIRSALTRNIQSLQALQSGEPDARLVDRGGGAAVARAPRVDPPRVARRRAGHAGLRRFALPRAPVRAAGAARTRRATSRSPAPTRAA